MSVVRVSVYFCDFSVLTYNWRRLRAQMYVLRLKEVLYVVIWQSFEREERTASARDPSRAKPAREPGLRGCVRLL